MSQSTNPMRDPVISQSAKEAALDVHDDARRYKGLTDIREIEARIQRAINLETAALRRRCEELEADGRRYLKAFGHTHVAGQQGNIDRCEQCGLDLRDPIHSMTAKPGGGR